MRYINKLILCSLLLGLSFIQGAESLREGPDPLFLETLQPRYLTPTQLQERFEIGAKPENQINLEIVPQITEIKVLPSKEFNLEYKQDGNKLFIYFDRSFIAEIDLNKPTEIIVGKIVYRVIYPDNITSLNHSMNQDDIEKIRLLLVNFSLENLNNLLDENKYSLSYEIHKTKSFEETFLHLLKAGVIGFREYQQKGNVFIDSCQKILLSGRLGPTSPSLQLEMFEYLAKNTDGPIGCFPGITELTASYSIQPEEDLLTQLFDLLTVNPDFDLDRFHDPIGLSTEDFQKYSRIKTRVLAVLDDYRKDDNNREKLVKMNKLISKIKDEELCSIEERELSSKFWDLREQETEKLLAQVKSVES